MILQYVDTAGIVAAVFGIGHILLKVGAMQTKIDTMWEWWKRQAGE